MSDTDERTATATERETTDAWDVVVVGDGPAGLTAATFTARHGLSTLLAGTGESILRRNAHLENFPGFPAGVDARLLLDAMYDQATSAGADLRSAEVTGVVRTTGDPETDGPTASPGFVVETAAGDRFDTRYVVAATKNAVDYLAGLAVELVDHGKTFVATDESGRTDVPGLYAAGRLAGKPHQAVVAAGHGAEVAVTLLEDDETPFYHDWVTPEGYFTGRGREVPPGCEEIPASEWQARARESRETMQRYFADAHSDRPEQHPSVAEGE
jgi:thioredoxin reductase